MTLWIALLRTIVFVFLIKKTFNKTDECSVRFFMASDMKI